MGGGRGEGRVWILKSVAFGTGTWGSLGQPGRDGGLFFSSEASLLPLPPRTQRNLSQAAGHGGAVSPLSPHLGWSSGPIQLQGSHLRDPS